MKAESSCDVLRLLFTWSDRTLAQDWNSALSPVPPAGDPVALETFVLRYMELRRRADNWSPRRYDRNNHRNIPNDDVVALLLDARKIDKEGPPRWSTGRRTEQGTEAKCVVCRGAFRAIRRSARYCSDTCKQTARRVRKRHRSDGQGSSGPDPRNPLSPQEGPSDRPDPRGAA